MSIEEARILLRIINAPKKGNRIQVVPFDTIKAILGIELFLKNTKSIVIKEVDKIREIGLDYEVKQTGIMLIGDIAEASIKLYTFIKENKSTNKVDIEQVNRFMLSKKADKIISARGISIIKNKYGLAGDKAKDLYYKWRIYYTRVK